MLLLWCRLVAMLVSTLPLIFDIDLLFVLMNCSLASLFEILSILRIFGYSFKCESYVPFLTI